MKTLEEKLSEESFPMGGCNVSRVLFTWSVSETGFPRIGGASLVVSMR